MDRFCPILPPDPIAVKSPPQFPGTLEPLEIVMMFLRRSLLVLALAVSVARCADQPTAVKAPAAPQKPPAGGKGAYLWWRTPLPAAQPVQMPGEAAAYGAALYEVLHLLDREGLDYIAVEVPPADVLWAGIRDRLERAARKR